MLRSTLPTDCITAAAAGYYQNQIRERGDLLNQQAPIGMIIHDVLAAIGLPENAIGMVMHQDHQRLGYGLTETVCTPMVCCFGDDNPATRLIQSKTGPRAVCEHHAQELAGLGFKIAL